MQNLHLTDLWVKISMHFNMKATTGSQLYKVSRGKDNFSLDSTYNNIAFSPDGNYLTSRGSEVIMKQKK